MLVTQNASSVSDGGKTKIKSEYDQMLWNIQHDPRWVKEVSLGKRVRWYRFSETIGNGNFSQVKLATHVLTRDKVAVKIIDKVKLDVKTRKMLNQEIKTMESLYHPNIIRLLEVVDTYRCIHLVLEYAPAGQLHTLVTTSGALPESTAAVYFHQLALAVGYMHRLGFVHRDIKAENVFISAYNTVKLGDLGFSAQLLHDPQQKLNTFCGSPAYAAPELFQDTRYAGPPVDVWALGVLLYFLLTAALPFAGLSVAELRAAVLDGRYTVPSHLAARPCSIIERALVQTPADRATVFELIADDWFAKPTQIITRGVRKNSLLTFARRFGRREQRESRLMSFRRDSPLRRIPDIMRSNKTSDISSANKAADIADTKRVAYARFASFDTSSLPSSSPEGMLELGRFVMAPSPETDLSSLCPVERMARERLQRLGVGSALLLEHLADGSRSPVIGAYRCLVSRMLEEQQVWNSVGDPSEASPPKPERTPPARDRGSSRRLIKLCTVL